ncbi:TPA: hypothetical protein QID76_004680 [Klebsiella aerogenes]|nr:hypothetical protein [Klebsiella aerogenes]
MNNELTAALLTIEKCRELSGCPAGVDLQDWVKQLAAENVGLKAANAIALQILNDEETMVTSLWASSIQKVEEKTPATDRIVAGIKADGVEQAANECYGAGYICETLLAYAQQLREGADK